MIFDCCLSWNDADLIGQESVRDLSCFCFLHLEDHNQSVSSYWRRKFSVWNNFLFESKVSCEMGIFDGIKSIRPTVHGTRHTTFGNH